MENLKYIWKKPVAEVREYQQDKVQLRTVEQIKTQGIGLTEAEKNLIANSNPYKLVVVYPTETNVKPDEISIKGREALGGKQDDMDMGVVTGEEKLKTNPEEGVEASANVSYASASYKDDEGEVNFFKSQESGEAKVDEKGASAKVEVRGDIVNAESEAGIEAHLGPRIGFGAEVKEDKAKVDTGIVEGEVKMNEDVKEIGVETPFGGASVDLEKAKDKVEDELDKIGDDLKDIFE